MADDMPPTPSSLSGRDYLDINRALRGLYDVQQIIDQAQKAGIECTEEDLRCKAVKEFLMQRKKVLFPGKP